MYQIQFPLGLRPSPHWKGLHRYSDNLAGFKGPTSKRGEGREGEGVKLGGGKERGGRDGNGRNGKGRKGRENKGRGGQGGDSSRSSLHPLI